MSSRYATGPVHARVNLSAGIHGTTSPAGLFTGGAFERHIPFGGRSLPHKETLHEEVISNVKAAAQIPCAAESEIREPQLSSGCFVRANSCNVGSSRGLGWEWVEVTQS